MSILIFIIKAPFVPNGATVVKLIAEKLQFKVELKGNSQSISYMRKAQKINRKRDQSSTSFHSAHVSKPESVAAKDGDIGVSSVDSQHSKYSVWRSFRRGS